MDNKLRYRSFSHDLDWKTIPAGTVLTKFICRSEEDDSLTLTPKGWIGNPVVELHGFLSDGGNIYITDEISYWPHKEETKA